MKIQLNNNKGRLFGNVKVILRLREHPAFCLRSPGAFFAPAFQRGQWDGKIRFITETGVFDTGMLPKLIDVTRGIMKELDLDEDIKMVDERDYLKPGKVPLNLEEYELRPYQREGIRIIKENEVNGVPFPRGIMGAATNAGKTIMAAAIHRMYKSKTVFLINSKELFRDAVEEIPKFLPGEVGIYASGHEVQWNDFMIIMVPTAYKRLDEIKHELTEYRVTLVDECDLATSKSYRTVLNPLYNSYVRIGLSGSPMTDPRKKEKNERLRSIFGNVIYEIKNKELIDLGFSSNVKVIIWKGNIYPFKNYNYVEEYEKGILKNPKRNEKVKVIAEKCVQKNLLPLLVIMKNHRHVKFLFKRFEAAAQIMGHEFFGLKIDWVHHKREDRFEVVKKFKEGKLDILIGSYILKRGKNFPMMKSIIHAGGGDSMGGVLQILGRATRTHESKTHTVVHDFWDLGEYLKRHSKHRLATYKKERLEVKELY